MHRIVTSLSICFFIVFFTNIAKADELMPANLDPGVLDRANTENFIKSRPLQKPEKLDVQYNPSALDQNSIKSPTFILNKVVFSGNGVISTKTLDKYIQPLIGKEITLEDIRQVTLKITELYRSKGFLTSLAYIPPQSVNNGIVDIRVIEGKIGNLKITGNKWVKDTNIKNTVFKANGIEKDTVFNVSNLKNSLRDLNGQPYLKGKVNLQRGEEKETTDIALDLQEKIPLGFDVSWGNQGRDVVGEQQAGLTVNDYNLTGFGDTLSTTTSLASGTVGTSTSYSAPISPWGTRLTLGYSHSSVDLGGDYKRYNIEGSSNLYSIALMQPIFRNNKFDIKSDLGFDFRDSKSTIQESTILSKYQIRTLRAGVTAIADDSKGRWIFRPQTSFGLPILGGQSSNSNAIGSSEFFKLNTNGSRLALFLQYF